MATTEDRALTATYAGWQPKVSSNNDLHDLSTEHRAGECACPDNDDEHDS